MIFELYLVTHLLFVLFAWLSADYLLQVQMAFDCPRGDCICEPLQNMSTILQPESAWSSFAFVIVGELVLLHMAINSPEKGGRMETSFAYRLTYLLLLELLGFGSFWFHAQSNDWAAYVDNLSIALYTCFILTYELFNVYFWPLFLLQSLVWSTSFWFLSSVELYWIRMIVYVSYIAVFFALKAHQYVFKHIRKALVEYLATLGCMGIALVFWILSINVCPGPYHAIWHVMTALATLILYFYLIKSDEEENLVIDIV